MRTVAVIVGTKSVMYLSVVQNWSEFLIIGYRHIDLEQSV